MLARRFQITEVPAGAEAAPRSRYDDDANVGGIVECVGDSVRHGPIVGITPLGTVQDDPDHPVRSLNFDIRHRNTPFIHIRNND
jgi:hypothetical protein